MTALTWLTVLVASVALLPQEPTAPTEPRGDYVVYELLTYRDRVESDGSQTRVIEARVLLRNAAAVSELGQLQWPYVETLAEVAFEAVVIQKADGRKVEVTNGSVEDVNPFGITGSVMSADVRFKKVTIPGLEPGDRLSYTILHRQRPLAPGRAFGEIKLSPALGDPVQSYELDLPRASGFRVRLREGLGVGWEEVAAPADRLVRRLRLKVPRVTPDDMKTLTKKKVHEWAEPDVIFTTFASWNEVAQWWWQLSLDRLQPDTSVKTQAASLVATGLSPRQKLERLHAFVSGSIRYLNVNFGVGRMQPRPAPQVLANRYGDCKDKHALLAALASSTGIDVRPVLIDSTRLDLRDDVPAPQQFDHMVSVARLGPEPESWLWLDGTDRFNVPGYLAPSLRDKRALLVETSGEARIVRTPKAPPFVGRNEVELKATLRDDGVLLGRTVWRFRSDGEAQLRAVLEAVPEHDRPELVKTSLASHWRDGKVTNVAVSDLTAVAEPLRVEFDAERPAPSGFVSGDRSLWIPLPPFGLPEADEAAPPDADALEFAVREYVIRAEVEIPPGLSARAPLSVSVERPFGKFESVYTVQGTRLTLARTLKLSTSSLGRDDAASYNGFRKAIGSDRDQKFLILGDIASAAAPTPAALHAEGLAAFDRKDYAKAVELLRKATEADPKLKGGFLDLGRALYEAGKSDEAVAAFTKQAEANPFHESAYAWRAHALERLGRGDEAEKDLLKQIEVAPFEAWAYNTLADRRTRQKRPREAADLYSRALAIEPKAEGRWVDLGWAEARGGRPAEARAALAHARSLDLPDWMKISAGGAYLLAGDARAAAEVASEGLAEMTPRSAIGRRPRRERPLGGRVPGERLVRAGIVVPRTGRSGRGGALPRRRLACLVPSGCRLGSRKSEGEAGSSGRGRGVLEHGKLGADRRLEPAPGPGEANRGRFPQDRLAEVPVPRFRGHGKPLPGRGQSAAAQSPHGGAHRAGSQGPFRGGLGAGTPRWNDRADREPDPKGPGRLQEAAREARAGTPGPLFTRWRELQDRAERAPGLLPSHVVRDHRRSSWRGRPSSDPERLSGPVERGRAPAAPPGPPHRTPAGESRRGMAPSGARANGASSAAVVPPCRATSLRT